MKVSIIIAAYNEEKYIRKCLESLAKQNYKDFEIIVVDDGSSDKTLQVLSNFQFSIRQPAGNFQFYSQNHQGPAKARNLGVKKAKGDILVFVDADMEFDKNFLRDLVQPIIKGITKGTYSTEEYVANWNNIWARCWNYNWGLPDQKRINPLSLDQQKDFRAILKSEFEKVGGFDNTGYTDTWTLSEKLKYKPIETQAVYYHYNPGNISEVFKQAKWSAKREYKNGCLGKLWAIIRANPAFSLLVGVSKAIKKQEPLFIIFKITYDFAVILGILERQKYA